MEFVTLTSMRDTPTVVFLSHIAAIGVDEDGETVLLMQGQDVHVQESIEEVVQRIREQAK